MCVPCFQSAEASPRWTTRRVPGDSKSHFATCCLCYCKSCFGRVCGCGIGRGWTQNAPWVLMHLGVDAADGENYYLSKRGCQSIQCIGPRHYSYEERGSRKMIQENGRPRPPPLHQTHFLIIQALPVSQPPSRVCVATGREKRLARATRSHCQHSLDH